jgi:Transcriptional regulator, AbiEi antitoxin, Type IV TA system/Transcriptional regulator, AbiEi antitoxin N-terminal domain
MPLNPEIRQNLLQIVSESLVVSRKWLLEKGINEHALDNLVKADQLDVIIRGVYKRPFIKVTWQDIVYSLQKIFNYNVVVGGVSALEMEGFAHYLPFNRQKQIHLYSSEPLPAWINELSDDFSFTTHIQTDLQSRIHHQKDLLRVLKSNTLSKFWKDDEYSFEISNPERAILEVLVDVPEKTSFEHAEQILQGMTSLSPSKLQDLLMVCDNIRIRRLFLWMAERQNHPWFKKLNLERISLGSGNRVLVKGGVLNKKYKITVPQEYE